MAQEAEEHLIFLLLITENNCYQSTAFFCVLAILADLNKCEYAEDEVHLWLGFLIFTVNCTEKKKKDWLWRLILKTGNFTICKEKLFWCETGCTRKSTFYILKSTAVTNQRIKGDFHQWHNKRIPVPWMWNCTNLLQVNEKTLQLVKSWQKKKKTAFMRWSKFES